MVDDAYSCKEYMLTPVTASRATPGSPGDAYSFFKSSLRMRVEKSFLQLLARWSLIGSRMRYSTTVNMRIIEAEMALQKFCADSNDAKDSEIESSEERALAQSFDSEWMTHCDSPGNRVQRR